MDKNHKFQILLAFACFIQISCAQNDGIKYESAKNICEKCTCLKGEDVNSLSHFVLGCSMKNLKNILAGWPEEFGTNHTGAQIVVTFSGNSISILQQLPETDAIVSFSCRHCGMKEITSAVFMDVINIKRLDLSWNDLTGDVLRPDVFRGRYSDREYEPIRLEELDLSYNKINTLDRRIFEHTPQLNSLNLGNNELDVIDITTMNAIKSVSNLERLDLSYNKLKTLPDDLFKSSRKLKELFLQGNKLNVVPASIGVIGASLQSLFIGDNPIEAITEDSFLGLNELTHLNMSAMSKLNVVDLGTFTRMKNLEVLLCNNNPNLVKFDLGSLKIATNLQVLDISNNNLRKLDVEYVFEGDALDNMTSTWKKIQVFQLAGNPWHCDCYLMKTIEEFEYHQGMYDDDNARCFSPYDLSGANLHYMKSQYLCQLPATRQQLTASIIETPSFLRQRSISLSIISVCAAFAIGLLVGISVVFVRRKLRKNDFGFTTPIRYTTVRNSTISVE